MSLVLEREIKWDRESNDDGDEMSKARNKNNI